MRDEDIKKRDAELDDFWDIDALLPMRRAPRRAMDTEATEIELSPIQEQGTRKEAERIPVQESVPERHFIPPYTKAQAERERIPDTEYTPTDSLLCRVRLFRVKSNYRYYENFVRDAMRLWAVKGEECAHVPFFSYVPQYEQMNRAQLQWYLWWRENFRRGVILTTDYSYVLLHAYEVINLSGKIDPKQGQETLCRLWTGFRDLFHQLDGCMPEWICDYSLLHALPPPQSLGRELLFVAMSRCSLKEFYVSAVGEDGYVRALLDFCSSYDYRKSKFYTKENAPLFDRVITGALREIALGKEKRERVFAIAREDTSRMVRDSFAGALCAYSIRQKIAVEYHSFSCSHDLRYVVGETIKYTENAIRASLGIRARLSIYALAKEIKSVLDTFLCDRLPRKETAELQRKREIEAYEKQYDLPRTPLSVSRAVEIERLSWSTTERLVEAFEEEQIEAVCVPVEQPVMSPKVCTPEPKEKAEDSDDDGAFAETMRPYLPFLRAALDCDIAAQRAAAQQAATLPDVIADEINSIAADTTGDILLEEWEDGYAVIEDYRAIALEWIDGGKEE